MDARPRAARPATVGAASAQARPQVLIGRSRIPHRRDVRIAESWPSVRSNRMVGGTTPPQSDSGEISRVLVLNLLWQTSGAHAPPRRSVPLTTPSLLSRANPRCARSPVSCGTQTPVRVPQAFLSATWWEPRLPPPRRSVSWSRQHQVPVRLPLVSLGVRSGQAFHSAQRSALRLDALRSG